jgi:hypothetical protein
MVGTAVRRWWPVLLVVSCLPVASAATLAITGGTIGSGAGTPAACVSSPTVVQNVGTASPNTTNVVSVDVSGIVAACGGGTVRLTVYNNTDAAQESAGEIPAGGGSVNLTLPSPVPLKDSHFVAVTLQGP